VPVTVHPRQPRLGCSSIPNVDIFHPFVVFLFACQSSITIFGGHTQLNNNEASFIYMYYKKTQEQQSTQYAPTKNSARRGPFQEVASCLPTTTTIPTYGRTACCRAGELPSGRSRAPRCTATNSTPAGRHGNRQ
jgi:hypothetical protein